jgi:hypothetical protein
LAALFEYKGPLVQVNQMLQLHDADKGGVAAPCFFCTEADEQLFLNVLEHLKNAHEEEINSMWVESRHKIGSMTLEQFKQHLINTAWFRDHNFLVWWEQVGVLMPHETCSAAVQHPLDNTIFCSFCFALVQKANWEVHCGTCIPIRSLETKPSRRCNRLMLFDKYMFFFILKII